MKNLLILLNFLLLGGILYEVSGFLFNGDTEVQYTTKSQGQSVKKENASAAKSTSAKFTISGVNEAAQILLGNNVFNVARCPEALNSRWGGNSVQMALLGIYRVGDFEGAIIQQKRGRQWGGPRRIVNNRNGTQQQTELPLKQFLRVGESLENGYVLSAIGSDFVTLSRGGAKLELRLETASKNLPSTVAAAAAAARRNRPNAQQMQQFMMMRQMRVMEQLIRQNNQPNQNNRSITPGRGNNRNR